MTKTKVQRALAGLAKASLPMTRRRSAPSLDQLAEELLRLTHRSAGPFSDEQRVRAKDQVLRSIAQEELDDADGFDPLDEPDDLWDDLLSDKLLSFAADDGRVRKQQPERRLPDEELIADLVGPSGRAKLVARGTDILLRPEADNASTELVLGGRVCPLERLSDSPPLLRVSELSFRDAIEFRARHLQDPITFPASWT